MAGARATGAVSALLLALVAATTPAGAEPPGGGAPAVDVGWAHVQTRTGWVAGAADVDGVPGAEVLLSAWAGGFSLAGADGAVRWRHEAVGPARAAFIGDVDADGAPDVAAQIGSPNAAGEIVVVSGRTGQTLHRRAVHSPVGRVAAGDLDGDGVLDLLVPSVDGRTDLIALRGPHFEPAWTATLPGQMSGYYVSAENLAVGDLDGDGRAEVVFATRETGNSGGAVHVLDGATGAVRWSRASGPVFGVALGAGRVVAVGWEPAGVTWLGVLHAYDAAGAPVWNADLAGHLRAAAVLVADLAGDGDPEIVAATGAWQQGSIGFGLDPSSMSVQAFSLSDGTLRWASKTAKDVVGLTAVPSPLGGADVAYGTGAPLSSRSEEDVALLSGRTGAPLWHQIHSADFGDDDVMGLAAADVDGDGTAELVHGFGQRAFAVRAIADGRVRSAARLASAWTAVDLTAAGTAVGGDLGGVVSAVEPGGALRWTAAVPGAVAAVAVADAPQSPADPVLVAAAADEVEVLALDPDTGARRWSTPAGVNLNSFSTHQFADADLDGDGVIDLVVGGGSATGPAVVAVSGRTGAILWRGEGLLPDASRGADHRPATGYVAGLAVVGDLVVAALLPTTSLGSPPNVVAFGAADGRLRWASALGGPAAADAAVAPLGSAHVAVNAGRNVTVLRTADGVSTASFDVGGAQTLVPLGARVLAVGQSVLAQATARLIGPTGIERTLDDKRIGRPVGAVAVPGHGVVVAGVTGIFVLDEAAAESGQLVVRSEAHLPLVERTPGQWVESPGIRRLVTAGDWVAGAADLQLLNGIGPTAAGAWVARLR